MPPKKDSTLTKASSKVEPKKSTVSNSKASTAAKKATSESPKKKQEQIEAKVIEHVKTLEEILAEARIAVEEAKKLEAQQKLQEETERPVTSVSQSEAREKYIFQFFKVLSENPKQLTSFFPSGYDCGFTVDGHISCCDSESIPNSLANMFKGLAVKFDMERFEHSSDKSQKRHRIGITCYCKVKIEDDPWRRTLMVFELAHCNAEDIVNENGGFHYIIQYFALTCIDVRPLYYNSEALRVRRGRNDNFDPSIPYEVKKEFLLEDDESTLNSESTKRDITRLPTRENLEGDDELGENDDNGDGEMDDGSIESELSSQRGSPSPVSKTITETNLLAADDTLQPEAPFDAAVANEQNALNANQAIEPQPTEEEIVAENSSQAFIDNNHESPVEAATEIAPDLT